MVNIRDLSSTMRNFSMEPNEVKITHLSHAENQRREAKRLRVPLDQVGSVGATDHVVTLSHAGTHVDALWHFGPFSEGKPSTKIDQIPLEWCFGSGVLLDFSHKKPGEAITTEDLKKELERIHCALKPMDIVLIRTGAEDFDDDPRFEKMASGLVKESLMWLLDRGVRNIGTDAYTLDVPLPYMAEELKKGNREGFFPVHYAGRERSYIHVEKLYNLKSLPRPFGFKVALFPIKIEDGAGGWTRAVAIEGEGELTKKPDLLDLSVPIRTQSLEDEEIIVNHLTHEEAARRLARRFGVRTKSLPTPDLYANDEISCSSHAGTHVKAPWHFAPVVEGTPAKTIDRVPLDRLYGDGVLLDFSHKRSNDPITPADLNRELDRIGYGLNPGNIVLIRTGAEDLFFNDPGFIEKAAKVSSDSLLWLFEKGITTVGTDSCISAVVHKAKIIKDTCYAEKMYNLKKLPRPTGFKVCLFPIKLENCSGAWTRAVAIL